VALVLLVLVSALGCSADDAGPSSSAPVGDTGDPIKIEVADGDRCDPIGGGRCLLPFPNDFFTVADRSTDTGRRVRFDRESMPANAEGEHVDPAELNRNDGFSPGATLAVLLPEVDLETSGAAPITDLESSLDPDAPIVLLDADTGERHPYWAELDANAERRDERLLLVHPAINFAEGHRIVVGLRNLVDAGGRPLPPTDAFEALRDGRETSSPELEARRPALEAVFDSLAEAGVEREELSLAWDFTVASERSLSERLLHMRDDAFEVLGDAAPTFAVTRVEESPTGPVLRTVSGTFEVPRYLTGQGAPGSVLNNGSGAEDPRPERNGDQTANFTCVVPRASLFEPSAMALFGHGLLGTAEQVRSAGAVYAGETNTTFCATNWIGMSTEDIPNAIAILQDLSRFRSLADRLQQGILHFLFLGRLLKHADGLASHPAFRTAAGRSLIDRDDLSFIGNSQGGILGGAASAVAQDWGRVVLGVPAMNYSVLLQRSIDFDRYGAVLAPAYPDAADRQLGILLVQMLWDRGENNGYAHHLTADPYPRTEAKDVLLFEAFGDHQVANIATETMARTIGARLRTPALAEGRSPDVEPLWALEPVGRFPFDGSGLVVWDFGTPAPPTENRPNRRGEDPHGKGSLVPEVREMVAAFLRSDGALVDVCDAEPCRTQG
jgi:hypothetical protein